MTRFCKILATAGEWRHNVLLEYGLQPPVWNTTSNGSIGIGIIKLPKSSETKDVLGFCEYPYLTDQWLMIWLEKTNLYWLAVDCWTRSIRTNDYKCIQIGSAYFRYTTIIHFTTYHANLPPLPSRDCRSLTKEPVRFSSWALEWVRPSQATKATWSAVPHVEDVDNVTLSDLSVFSTKHHALKTSLVATKR